MLILLMQGDEKAATRTETKKVEAQKKWATA